MNIQNSLELGKSYLLAGDYLGADVQFSQILDVDATDKQAWFLKGISIILAGRYIEGVSYCRKASFSPDDDIVGRVVEIFRGTSRDISRDFVRTGKALVQEQRGRYRSWGNIFHKALGKILAVTRKSLYKGLHLESINYMNESLEFVLSYSDFENDRWIIQVFQDQFLWGFPYIPDRTLPQHLLAASKQWRRVVNFKIPTKRDVTDTSYLIEIPYIISNDIELTPELVLSYGFAFDKWRSISFHGKASPICYLPFIEQYLSQEEFDHWMVNYDILQERQYKTKLVDTIR